MRIICAIVVTAVLAAALLGGGCGKWGDVSGAGDSSGGATLTNPDDVFQKVRDGAASLKSVKYTADVEITGTADPAAGDPQSAQQLAQGVKVHSEGAISKDPGAVEMKVDLSLGAQTLNAEVKANDSGMYIGLMGQWYAVPPEQTDKLKQFTTMAPADIVAKLGLNLDNLQSQRTLAGTETVDGAECYHVTGKPDAKQIAQGILKLLNSPDLQNPDAAAAAQSLNVDPAQAQKLETMIKDITVDYWVDAQTGFIRKGEVVIKMEKQPGDTETQFQTMDTKVSFTASGFNEAVTVESPPNPQPFDKLGEALMGGVTPAP